MYFIDRSTREPAAEAISHTYFERELRDSQLNGCYAIDFVHRTHVAGSVENVLSIAEAVREIGVSALHLMHNNVVSDLQARRDFAVDPARRSDEA